MTDLNSFINNEKKTISEIFNHNRPTLVTVRSEWSGGSHLMDLIIDRNRRREPG